MSDQDSDLATTNKDDLLWQQLKTIPAFRALLRAVEARFYQQIDLPEPTLDVGCGDGHFAQMTFDRQIQFGIDPWWGPLNKAEKSNTYGLPNQAEGDHLPFPDHAFGSAFSNSVLEHIPDIQPVLDEVSRVLQPGAPFVITVPSHLFTEFLGGAALFNKLGLEGLANGYQRQFNRISRHAHTDTPEVWAERLAHAGFSIERWQYYFSRKALQTLEIGHAQGLPSAVLHALTGHWIIGPWESNLQWTDNWVRPYYEEPFPDEGAYLLFIARKESDIPIDFDLPNQHPFTVEELTISDDEERLHETTNDVQASPRPRESDVDVDVKEESLKTQLTDSPSDPRDSGGNLKPLVTVLLAAIVLLLAFLGQSTLRTTPDEPASGLRWLGLTFIALLILIWYLRPPVSVRSPTFRRPRISEIPRRRWIYLLGVLLALAASRFASASENPAPTLAIITWLSAIALSVFALYDRGISTADRPRISRFTLVISPILFFTALAIRLYNLSRHPFILNGTEASIGLDILGIIAGNPVNPFGTGWLTNPNLPLFLLSLPVNILGPSTFSLRLISPFVGALTVVATFLIGSRLYGRMTGLIAAILLLGSHFHLHFSRLGLTNAWDALLVLLSLGFIALAWQKNPEENRGTWLLAGLAAGFSAYLYTSAHLLPLMLLFLFFLLLIFDREGLRKQWRHILAAAAIAIIVTLPQLLYYQAHPGVFMERANVLGILQNQSGWLTRESQITGLSQFALISQQFWQSALAFNATLDTGTSYGPSIPLLNFISGILFLIGLILAGLRINRIKYGILVVWVITTILFAGTLLLNPPNSHRLIIAAPAVSLLAAVAAHYFVDLFISQKQEAINDNDPEPASKRNATVVLTITLIIAVFIALYDVGYYFGPYRSDHQFGDRNTEIADSMADYLNSLEGDWAAYFFGPPSMYVGFPTIPFLASDFQEGMNLFNVEEGILNQSLGNEANNSFIFLPERYGELAALKAQYPEGEEFTFSGYYADPLFYIYEINSN